MDVDTAIIVPMSLMPIVEDDGLTIEQSLVYDFAGIAVQWNFVTTAGVYTCVAITPTTGDDHDISEPLANVGMYGIEIPAASGDANNDTEGFGWITGIATGLMAWRGPVIGCRAAAINNSLVDGATIDVNVTAQANIDFGATQKASINTEVDNGIITYNLDHLALTATAAADMTTEVADNTILSRMLANGDTSAFVPSTDGLQAIRDVAPHGSTMVGTDSAVLATTIGSAVGADISADIAAIPTTMVGTDSAALASAWTATRAGYVDELAAANLPTDISNIPTTMRGTDSAALASVVGALADGAAAGEVTTADTLMQYLKQLINILIGTTGIVAFPAEAAPANGVSLAEVIRAIAIDVAGLNGDAMKGTDGANTTVPDAAGTAAIPGDLMGLANDAITAAKFDESTAFPVVATDTGATQIARVGADGDTLETLSDEIATAQTDLDTLTDARGEPAQGAPPASNTTNGKIDQMYKRWRNKQDSDGSTEQYYGDDTSTVDSKRTVSAAAGTVTKAETVSGP